MPHQTIWKSGNSLVITISKHLARVYALDAGSVVSVERMKHTAEGFRVIPPPPQPAKPTARLSTAARRSLSRGLKNPTAKG